METLIHTDGTPVDSKACRVCREAMADLLLAPEEAPVSARQHLDSCSACAAEFRSLADTMGAMDAWTAPEPTAFFDTRLHARLREEIAAQPESLMERLRSFLLFSTGRQLRPALVGALALAMLISGGTVAGVYSLHGHQPVATSATVNDLKIMDNNAEALQQMNQLLNDNDGDDTAPPTT